MRQKGSKQQKKRQEGKKEGKQNEVKSWSFGHRVAFKDKNEVPW